MRPLFLRALLPALVLLSACSPRARCGANPFNRLGPYGLQLDLPQAAPSPDGAIVRNLLSMWSRIVPRTP